jgi:hypothetical protein
MEASSINTGFTVNPNKSPLRPKPVSELDNLFIFIKHSRNSVKTNCSLGIYFFVEGGCF